jgi:hypothetical protein
MNFTVTYLCDWIRKAAVGRKCSMTWGNNDPRRPYTRVILGHEEQGRKKRKKKSTKIWKVKRKLNCFCRKSSPLFFFGHPPCSLVTISSELFQVEVLPSAFRILVTMSSELFQVQVLPSAFRIVVTISSELF